MGCLECAGDIMEIEEGDMGRIYLHGLSTLYKTNLTTNTTSTMDKQLLATNPRTTTATMDQTTKTAP